MSCRQNTSDLVESESPDGPGPFQATGAGAPLHKERSVSVRIPPRNPAQAPLTSTTPGYEQHSICLYSLRKVMIILLTYFSALIY